MLSFFAAREEKDFNTEVAEDSQRKRRRARNKRGTALEAVLLRGLCEHLCDLCVGVLFLVAAQKPRCVELLILRAAQKRQGAANLRLGCALAYGSHPDVTFYLTESHP